MELRCSNPECGAALDRYGGRLSPVIVQGSGSVLFLWTCGGCVADEACAGETECPSLGDLPDLQASGNG